MDWLALRSGIIDALVAWEIPNNVVVVLSTGDVKAEAVLLKYGLGLDLISKAIACTLVNRDKPESL